MTDVNRQMFEEVVEQIGDLRDEVVFLGGAVAGLLTTSPAAEPIRETDDVDCIVEVGSSLLSYQQIEAKLIGLGWQPGSMVVQGDPLCRFRKGKLTVDVMPTDPTVLGFAGRWARDAIPHAELHSVGQWTVKVISAPFFLATKIEAFLDRGNGDYLASHDLEDLVIVVDGRPGIMDEVGVAPGDLREFLAEKLGDMWSRLLSESIPGALRGAAAKCQAVERRLEKIRTFG